MLISVFITLIIWFGRLVGFLLSVTVWPICRLIGKKRIVRWLTAIMNDPRVEQGLTQAGAASGILQFRMMLAQMRIAEDGDTPPDAPTPTICEGDGPIQESWPATLPPPPNASLISEVSLGMRSAGPEFEDWRFATSEAFRASGAMLMITEGCADWARMAKQRGLPPELVKTSFTGGALLSAFQLGLIVGEYTYEQDLLDNPLHGGENA